jgi:hypothetical protein
MEPRRLPAADGCRIGSCYECIPNIPEHLVANLVVNLIDDDVNDNVNDKVWAQPCRSPFARLRRNG